MRACLPQLSQLIVKFLVFSDRYVKGSFQQIQRLYTHTSHPTSLGQSMGLGLEQTPLTVGPNLDRKTDQGMFSHNMYGS